MHKGADNNISSDLPDLAHLEALHFGFSACHALLSLAASMQTVSLGSFTFNITCSTANAALELASRGNARVFGQNASVSSLLNLKSVF